uniref:Uncharacterized protein n=1 Tax=Rhizophora mucronata TaxID=61149 RepID=A0A2P2Q5B9_RHIMU
MLFILQHDMSSIHLCIHHIQRNEQKWCKRSSRKDFLRKTKECHSWFERRQSVTAHF